MIVLEKKFLLAKGGERECYIHPQDDTRIIKILHLKGKHNRQNELESIYMQYLSKRKVDFTHIPKCYGWIDTNKGKGLLFDRAMNYDKSDAKKFRFLVRDNVFTLQQEEQLLDELRKYLENNRILFVDVSLSNVFCQEFEKGKFRLIVLDGLGGRRLGVKFYFYMLFAPFAKYKIHKQWKKLMENVKKERTYYSDKQI